ncbi:MAG: universal stress protein [Prevotellaceae bacterium]|jgi:nucleotide-binding universal stress UspA family protein|nr:universal stress protein [Prevotellaceae bacterium]
MKKTLVTLAIRTSRRAEKIKEELESNGIKTVIQNINIDVPAVGVGVRIRIAESDLPRALRIVEEVEKAWETKKDDDAKKQNFVLIPIDFADFVQKTIDFGFDFAHALQAEIVLLHVYSLPPFSISTFRDTDIYTLINSEQLRRLTAMAEADKKNFENLLKKRITEGELPDVKFSIELLEGVADEEIIDYCKRNNPRLVVMGTHGKKLSTEMIGSVTGEVLDSCVSPVFAVPIQSRVMQTDDIQRITFLTDFDQKDLIAIDALFNLFKGRQLEIFFLHISEKKDKWNEVMLEGIKSYFSTHYENIATNYEILNSQSRTKTLTDYLNSNRIDLLAFNAKKRNLFSRLFNPSLAYKMVLGADTPMLVTHI